MKRIFIIIFVIISQNICAQIVSHPDAVEKASVFGFNKYENGELFFRDGSKVRGLIKITTDNKIKFKTTSETKKQVFDFKKVKSVKKDHGEEYFYKINNNQVLLLKREITDVINLYSQDQDVDIHDSNGVDKGFYRESMYKNFYIGTKDSYKVEFVPSKQTTKKFTKVISTYIADCSKLVALLKDKKTIKENFENDQKSIVENVIDYYHKNCKK